MTPAIDWVHIRAAIAQSSDIHFLASKPPETAMRKLAPSFLVTWLTLLPACLAQDKAPATPPAPPPPAAPAAAQPATPAAATPAPVAGSFKITFDEKLQAEPYSGRIYLALNDNPKVEPRRGMGDWFRQNPIFAMDVKDIPVGGSVDMSGAVLAYPSPMADLKPGDYSVQAIARKNLDSSHAGFGEGDLYSEPVTVSFKAGDSATVELKLTKAASEPKFQETDRVKEYSIVSPSLSAFYGHEVKLRAGVILPEGWVNDPTKQYPTVYFLGGFGSDHRFAPAMLARLPKSAANCLVIVPDPSCGLGYTAFADSANNGPRGKAFVEELIPNVEGMYHGAQNTNTRVVSGISSGGWAALWLTITYPEQFWACWSYCPDPVDFRDFQKIDIYADHANMYKDEAGNRRPLARTTDKAGVDKVNVYYEDFCKQEWVLGPGGQIHSFEAVFSPKGPDGKPLPLFDRKTGDVNHDVAMAWEKYDIRLTIDRNWATLGSRIAGKLHIYAGERDNFYLEGSARLLGAALKNVDPKADFHIVKGMGHDIHRPSFDVMFRVLADPDRLKN